jgi:spore maturation protein SpmA
LLNGVFVAAVVVAVVFAAWSPGGMQAVTQGALAGARDAAELAIGLTGALALFLGLMRVASEAGLLAGLARAVGPVLRRLFPGVPDGHPALSAMVLNVSATALGLGNAATPFGIQAMRELDRLNPRPGTATDAMVLFLAINTAGFGILPTTVLSLRVSAGSAQPAAVLLPIWIASAIGTLTAVAGALALARFWPAREPEPAARPDVAADQAPVPEVTPRRSSALGLAVGVGAALAVLAGLAVQGMRAVEEGSAGALAREAASGWALPALLGGVVLVGWARRVPVYEALVEGGKEGFRVAIGILPYLVAVLVMVGMLRASGALGALVALVAPATALLGVPAEVLPVALLRPLSGSGALGLTADVLRTHGPDGPLGLMASAMQGSTETTFYVLAVYCGAVGIRRTRHAVAACLLADAAAILAAVWAVRLLPLG